MGAAEEHALLIEWGYDAKQASDISGHVPSNGSSGNGATPDPAAHRQYIDRLKFSAWWDDQIEADHLEAEGDPISAEAYRAPVDLIDDLYEVRQIGGSLIVQHTDKWGRLNVTDELDDEDEEEETEQDQLVVTEADIDRIWDALHPDDVDDSGVIAIGTEHVAAWGHEHRH